MSFELSGSAEELRNKALKKKIAEKEDETKKRLLSTVQRRDDAIKMIEEYQDQTGIPNDDEVDAEFVGNLEEFREKEDDKNL